MVGDLRQIWEPPELDCTARLVRLSIYVVLHRNSGDKFQQLPIVLQSTDIGAPI